jgi:hypothetical protein
MGTCCPESFVFFASAFLISVHSLVWWIRGVLAARLADGQRVDLVVLRPRIRNGFCVQTRFVMFGLMVLIVVSVVWCHGWVAANYGQSHQFQQSSREIRSLFDQAFSALCAIAVWPLLQHSAKNKIFASFEF